MCQKADNPTSPPLRLSRKRKLLFAAVIVIAMLGLVEIAARVIGLRPQSSAQRLEHHMVADPELGFACEPNQGFRVSQIRGQPIIHTDSRGLRVTINPASQPDQPVVLCVGDSTTFCAEVDDEHTWPSRLSLLLAGERPCQVVNAAVRGYSTVQSIRMLDRQFNLNGNVRAVIYVYCENDLIENVNPIVYYPLKAPVMRWRDGGILPIEVTDPAVPWGQSFGLLVRQREKSWARHATGIVRQHSALANWAVSRLHGGADHGLEQHAGPDDCRGPVWPGHPAWPAAQAWAKEHHAEDVLVETIRMMDERCRRAGATLLVAEYPVGLREHTADIPQICRRAGAKFVDVGPAFNEHAGRYMAVRDDGRIDGHLNEQGAETMARALAPRVLEVVSR